MKKTTVLLFVITLLFSIASVATAQKKARLGKVCGDPTLPCKSRDNFAPSDLPLDTGKNYIIADSVPFYAIVLKNVSMKNDDTGCEKAFPETERLETQDLFPNNKVFTVRCSQAGENYYKGIKFDIAFIGVYAGKTLSEANAFLKMVRATNRFPGIRVRKIQAGINGT